VQVGVLAAALVYYNAKFSMQMKQKRKRTYQLGKVSGSEGGLVGQAQVPKASLRGHLGVGQCWDNRDMLMDVW